MILAAKRCHEDDDGTSGTLASTDIDADVVSEKRRRREAYHKPRPPSKNNPLAFIQLSPSLTKLQQVATRESGVSEAEWDKVCEAANKAISLLQPGNRTSDVAATCTSHATCSTGQHVFEIFAMDADDKCQK